MTRRHGCVFDMDGTLVDSMSALEGEAVRLITNHYDVSENQARQLYQLTVGHPFRVQLNRMFPSQIKHNEHVAKQYALFHQKHAPTFKLGPGVVDLLADLAARGIKTALVSSTRTDIVQSMHQLRKLGLDWIGGYNGFPKDHQMITAMDDLGLDPSRCVYYGDSEVDGHYAQSAGVSFYLVDIDSVDSIVRTTCLREPTDEAEA